MHDETKPQKTCLFLVLKSTEDDWRTRYRKFRVNSVGANSPWGETGIIKFGHINGVATSTEFPYKKMNGRFAETTKTYRNNDVTVLTH